MKILAFAASNSRHSINKQLVSHAADVYKTEIDTQAEIEILDLNDYEMPIFSVDREEESGVQPLAQQFHDKIGAADAILISYAEHNGSYTAAYKNIFDWTSRINPKVFQGKPMLIMSASPGPGGAASVLKVATDSAPYFTADVRGSFSVGPFSAKFDADAGKLIDPELMEQLRAALNNLK